MTNQQAATRTRYTVEFTVRVDFAINDPDVVTRVLENHDAEHQPRAPYSEAPYGWKDMFYDLDERGVAEMLAYNCGLHDRSLNNLDGWADLQPDAIDILSVDTDLETVTRDGEFLW